MASAGRARNQRPGEAVIDRATLEGYLPFWERPVEDELASYDEHHASDTRTGPIGLH